MFVYLAKKVRANILHKATLRLKKEDNESISVSSNKNERYSSSPGQKIIYDRDRLEKLALPRGWSESRRPRKKHHKSINVSRLPLLIDSIKSEKDKSTISSIQKALIYGVNLSQVPSLNEKFRSIKNSKKENKDLRKTIYMLRRMNRMNKKMHANKA